MSDHRAAPDVRRAVCRGLQHRSAGDPCRFANFGRAGFPSGAEQMSCDDFQHLDDAGASTRRECRIGRLLSRTPEWMRRTVAWLRRPQARWVRIPAGVLLIFGSVLSILPVFGLWMLPLGVVLLSEDVKALQRAVDRVLAWIERRHPSWMGPDAPRVSAGDQAR